MGSGFLRARSQLAFLAGLIIASAIVVSIERRQYVPVADIMPSSLATAPATTDVKAHWAFVERNRDATTGLVSVEDGGKWTSLSGVGDTLRALVAAHRLELIDGRTLYASVDSLLVTLAAVPVAPVPGRIDIQAGRVEQVGEAGVSALAAALELIAWSYPANRGRAAAELERWRAAARVETTATSARTPLAEAADALMRAAMTEKGAQR